MKSALPLLLLSACVTPAERTAPAYVAELSPLLQENGLLAEQVLLAAAGVYNGSLEGEQLAQRWQEDITPLAEHLRDHALLSEPPSEWAERHAELVDIWSDRAEAYRSLSTALDRGDRERWEAASATAENVKIREEQWFIDINTAMASSWVRVDQYP